MLYCSSITLTIIKDNWRFPTVLFYQDTCETFSGMRVTAAYYIDVSCIHLTLTLFV